MTYYLIFFLLLGASFLRKFGPEIERFLYLFLLFSLFIFCAFRYEIGCDWLTYKEIYNYDNAVYFFRQGGTLEFGYNLSMIGLKALGLGFQAFNILIALIFFTGLNAIAQRNINPIFFLALAFPIVIVNLPMSGLRQAAAFGFLCFASLSFIDKKMFRYILFVTLATSFHSSAIIFLLLSPFLRFELTQKNILLASIFLAPIAGVILTSSYGNIAISRYVDSDLASSGSYFRVGILFLVGSYFLLFLKANWKELFPRDYKFILLSSIAMIGCFFILLLSTVIADRLGFYLWIPALIILARMQTIPNRYRQLSVASSFIGLLLIFTFWANYSYFFDRCYNPYQMKFLANHYHSIDFFPQKIA